MKKFLFILCFFCIYITNGQDLAFQWAKSIGGPSNSGGYGIVVDPSGNVYTTGTFSGVVDFDPGAGTYTLASVGIIDVFVSKLDANGNFIWAKQIGGTNGNLFSQSIAIDATNNIYVVGQFAGTADFDPGPGVFNIVGFGTGGDNFFFKLDSSGNFVWAKRTGGTASQNCHSISVDNNSGTICIVGVFAGTADFDPGPSSYTLTNAGGGIFILKLDQAGNFIWVKQLGNSNGGDCYSTTIDATGNIYSTGVFSGTVDFDPGPGTFNVSTLSSSNTGDFVLKLDAMGNFIWAKQISGTAGNVYPTAITLDSFNNVYTTGYFVSGAIDFDPGIGTFSLNPLGYVDLFVLKLNASGNFLWAKQIGGPATQLHGYSIAIDAFNNVFTSGDFYGNVDFDPGSPTYNINSTASSIDIFVSKLDASGNFLLAKNLGGNTVDRCYSITTDAASNLYGTGIFGSTADFDPGFGNYPLTAVAVYDTYINKLQPCPFITTNISSQMNVLCNSMATGSVTIAASGGSGFTYSWSPTGVITPSAAGLQSGTFVCNVTNSCNSSASQTVLITQPPILNLTITASNTVVCTGNPCTLTAFGNGGNGTITYTWNAGPINNVYIINPTTASIYTVNITDANNCNNTQTISISTSAFPTISVNNGTICTGSSFTINPIGASTYTFSGGSAIVSPTSNTTFSVTGTNSFGCVSSNTAVSSVTVNPTPTITANSGSICAGDSFTIIPTGANTYTFSNGSAIVSPTSNTTYSVTGTNSFGCVSSNTTVSSVTVNPTPTITANSGSICAGDSFTIIPSGANTYTLSGSSAIVSPTSNTTYSVMGTNSFGCVSSNTTVSSVTVNPTPTITVSSGSICAGDSFTILPTGALSYTVSGGNFVVSPIATTTYSIIGSSINNCTNSAISTITVNNLPLVTIVSSSNIICVGQTVTLTASGALSYNWSNLSTATNIIINPTNTTTYSVSGVDSLGCINTALLTQSVSLCTDLVSLNLKEEPVTVFPNPTNGIINFFLSPAYENSTLEIYNLFGQIIFSRERVINNSSFNIEYLLNGAYLMRIYTDKNSKIIKVIKQ